jgi:DNA repair exonuclease SbcCD ATPase subunit
MIIFKTIKYRNFLSVGNNPIELDLRKNQTTLIVGANGEGKSILLDALSFVLFGKAHRNVNKPQLVNSINGKHTLVEVDFSIGQDEYLIKRGMHPNIFEIHKNGTLLNQDSKSRDYQKVLETNILKLNHKSFHQIVVLGSSSFIPFMQLPAFHRREVIEDLLDSSIFSKMRNILRERKQTLKDNQSNIGSELSSLESQIELQKKHIKNLDHITSGNRTQIEKEIKSIDKRIEKLIQKSKDIQIDEFDEDAFQKTLTKMKKLNEFEGGIKSKLERFTNQQTFFETNDTCHACSQSITKKTKTQMLNRIESKLSELNDGYKKLQAEMSDAEQCYFDAVKLKENVALHAQAANLSQEKITECQTRKKELLDQLNALQDASKLQEYKDQLDVLQEELFTKHEERLSLIEQETYFGLSDELLKDTGIRTKIIKQYLPIMNKLINEYLQIFDFFVSFTIDENFNEKIRSRHRDDFSYSSFSEGEKARIDLALMFTWRQIAKLKNSTNTNLLILDETFDSSLDSDGVENLLKVLYTMDQDTNTFIISHKSDVLEGKFQNKLLFKKVNNFTEMFDGRE